MWGVYIPAKTGLGHCATHLSKFLGSSCLWEHWQATYALSNESANRFWAVSWLQNKKSDAGLQPGWEWPLFTVKICQKCFFYPLKKIRLPFIEKWIQLSSKWGWRLYIRHVNDFREIPRPPPSVWRICSAPGTIRLGPYPAPKSIICMLSAQSKLY